jgi:hypothetical protein
VTSWNLLWDMICVFPVDSRDFMSFRFQLAMTGTQILLRLHVYSPRFPALSVLTQTYPVSIVFQHGKKGLLRCRNYIHKDPYHT